jgi:prepilin-type N-terminal cleavage/methylation domain-containing protein
MKNRLLRPVQGFTLIEMLVVVALLGIFLAIAAPSFAGLIRSNKVQAAADELVTVLQYARSEAITRGVTVTLTADSATTWNAGFNITAAGQILRRIDAGGLQSGITVSSGAAQASFSATGTTGGTTSQCFTLCPADQTGQCRFVGVSVTGRITPPSIDRPLTGECT